MEETNSQQSGISTASQWLKSNGWLHFVLFLILIFSLANKFEYFEIMERGPQSVHRWRQADSAVQAMCYYENGMRFFEPCVFNLHNGSGAAVSEFPILYYCAAGLYHVFGPHDGILRWLNFLLFAAGLFCFSRMLYLIMDNLVLALTVPLILMCAPVIVFYSFNFIPNTPALGLCMMSIYFYYEYFRKRKRRFFGAAVACMLLAGMIKITFLILFLSWLGTYVITRIPAIQKRRTVDFFPPWQWIALATIVVFGAAFGWVLWAKYYNELHHSGLFLAKIKPIWTMVAKDIDYTFKVMKTKTLNYFLPIEMTMFLLTFLIFNLFSLKKIRLEINVMMWLLILGSIAYLLLFFEQLRVHNYYYIDVMLVPLVVTSVFVWCVLNSNLERWQYWLFMALFLLMINTALNSAYYYNHAAYRPNHSDMKNLNPSVYKTAELQKFFEKHGVKKEDKVVSMPDRSPNATLYYYQRKGWSETFQGKNMIARLSKYHKEGARYLLINDKKYKPVQTFMDTVSAPAYVFDFSIHLYDLNEILGEPESDESQNSKSNKQK